ncbi:isochorismate synthase [Maribacter sedimenticola]|uniref:Isochorismate synthase n=1 Tax=Maribacter sedimenticola TaxID=228956 RepID=A0ABY1SJS4_9FLAO|nr:chorismate-binding protein [Maribacter sedimenticola]SNR65959.1 isochorismate synthase [Maribacter sedimenticola]
MVQELFNRTRFCLNEHLPFVLYRKPNTHELIGIFQDSDEVHTVVDYSETGFVFAPFDADVDAIYIKRDAVLKSDFTPENNTLKPIESSVLLNVDGKEGYIRLVKKALSYIEKGTFDKVVLSRKVHVELTDTYHHIFQRLLTTYPEAFCYYWHHPKIGTWMGATPEILIKTSGTQFTTMSLAGTQSIEEGQAPSWSYKELNEQQVVTDYIVDVLKENVQALKVLERESVRAGQLWHLRTELTGVIAPSKFGAVLKALHPTPAVCGNPLQNAKRFILYNESYKRSFYTGFLGELNLQEEMPRNRNRKNQENSAYKSIRKSSELYVNLRCMQLVQDKANIYVGGGITKDSDPEREWEETAYKSKTMLRILNNK